MPLPPQCSGPGEECKPCWRARPALRGAGTLGATAGDALGLRPEAGSVHAGDLPAKPWARRGSCASPRAIKSPAQPSEQRTERGTGRTGLGARPGNMRLGPAIRLLQAPLRACVVPKAHISAKPAKSPTSASVSTWEAAGPAREGWQSQNPQEAAGFRLGPRKPGWSRARGRPPRPGAARGDPARGLSQGGRGFVPTAASCPSGLVSGSRCLCQGRCRGRTGRGRGVLQRHPWEGRVGSLRAGESTGETDLGQA